MKVSVITATLNSAGTLGDCLRSVNQQEYPDMEHLVMDGGSADGTRELAEEHGGGHLIFRSSEDRGIYDALNKGIAAASGEVIGFLHSDDRYAHKEVLSKVMTLFMDETVDGVYGDLQYVSSDMKSVVRHWRSGSFSIKRLHKGWMPPHPALFLRKRVYDAYGTFDLSFRIASDYDLVLRVLKEGRVRLAYLPEVIVQMRLGGASNRSIGSILRKSREDLAALKKNNIPHPFLTLFRKNLSKLPQFFIR